MYGRQARKHGKIAVFRIDCFAETPQLLEEPAVTKPKGYSIGAFAKKAFRMFDADHEIVTLLCENSAMNTVIDHFGNKVKMSSLRSCIRKAAKYEPAWVKETEGLSAILDEDW